MDYLPFGGQRRGFMPRVSVSSLITHRCVVLVFASLFPYLCLLFSAVDAMATPRSGQGVLEHLDLKKKKNYIYNNLKKFIC